MRVARANDRWLVSPTLRDPARQAFVLAAAKHLWQKDIPAAFAIVFPDADALSRSAVGRFLVRCTSPEERSIAVQPITPTEFAARWLAGGFQ